MKKNSLIFISFLSQVSFVLVLVLNEVQILDIFLSSKIVVIQRVSFWIGNLTFFILLYLNLSRQDLFNLLLDLLSIQSISTCAEGPNQREDEFTIDYCGSVLDITEAGIELGVLEIFD